MTVTNHENKKSVFYVGAYPRIEPKYYLDKYLKDFLNSIDNQKKIVGKDNDNT